MCARAVITFIVIGTGRSSTSWACRPSAIVGERLHHRQAAAAGPVHRGGPVCFVDRERFASAMPPSYAELLRGGAGAGLRLHRIRDPGHRRRRSAAIRAATFRSPCSRALPSSSLVYMLIQLVCIGTLPGLAVVEATAGRCRQRVSGLGRRDDHRAGRSDLDDRNTQQCHAGHPAASLRSGRTRPASPLAHQDASTVSDAAPVDCRLSGRDAGLHALGHVHLRADDQHDFAVVHLCLDVRRADRVTIPQRQARRIHASRRHHRSPGISAP